MNKDILNSEAYTIAPRGPSSSHKYNNMVEDVIDVISSMSKDINDSEHLYHKDNITRDMQDKAMRAAVSRLHTIVDALKDEVASIQSGTIRRGYISLGDSDYYYAINSTIIPPIDPLERAVVNRESGFLFPRCIKYISKVALFDLITGKTVTVDNIASVQFPNDYNVAFVSDVRRLYNRISSDRWVACTKYSVDEHKQSDSISIHIDVPTQAVSSYNANYFCVDVAPLGFYDVQVTLNSINGTTTTYTYNKALNKIEQFFATKDIISMDITITNSAADRTIYNGYDSFMFIVNNIDIAHVKTARSSIMIPFRIANANGMKSIEDIYAVDESLNRIDTENIRYTIYVTDGTTIRSISKHEFIPLHYTTAYIRIDYLVDNILQPIHTVAVEYTSY